MTEKKLETYLRDQAKRRGGLALKLVIVSLIGFPDRTVIGPGRSIGFAELKTVTGRASRAQLFWIDKLRAFGFVAEVIRTREEADDFLATVLTE